jgi:protocatechuate 3,4-dioxygenase alpha subunit
MKPLVPTGEMTLGPFFPPEFAAGANDLTMLEGRRVRGEPIEVTGRVVQADGQALDNLVLEIWQADADGRYDSGDFLGWGRAATDRDGVYRFLTIRPGKAEGRAPHINFLILYSGLMRQLHTVMFFEDADDPVLNAVQDKASLIARRVDKGYVFDIRLRGEGETPFFDD